MTTEQAPELETQMRSLSEETQAIIQQLVSKATIREEAKRAALRKVGGEEGVIWPSHRYEVSEEVQRAELRESA